MAVNVARRIALCSLACLAAVSATALSPSAARASAASRVDPNAPVDVEPFLRFALSSARMQARAAELALLKQPRPEVAQAAEAMLEFRRSRLQALEALAHRAGVTVAGDLEFEHAIVLENLEPLDFLALSRRWVEVQTQALQQELLFYRAFLAQDRPDPQVAAFARDALPDLDGRLQQMAPVRDGIGGR
jgi:putative membrane protein